MKVGGFSFYDVKGIIIKSAFYMTIFLTSGFDSYVNIVYQSQAYMYIMTVCIGINEDALLQESHNGKKYNYKVIIM